MTNCGIKSSCPMSKEFRSTRPICGGCSEKGEQKVSSNLSEFKYKFWKKESN